MEPNTDLKQAPTLLANAFRQFTRIVEAEIALAKEELSRSASRAGTGLAMLGIAAILALTALNVLAGALVAWVASTGLTAGVAALIVGGGILAAGIVLALAGKSRLSADALAPKRAARNVKTDIQTIRESTHA